jgi:S-adenosylmethionine decarboxylase
MTSTDKSKKRGLGEHWLLECYGPLSKYNEDQLGALMRKAASAGGATVLMCHTHKFSTQDHSSDSPEHSSQPQGGVTGVLMLAESHISVHTWPEHSYAAFDIFMCHGSDPMAACEAIRQESPDTDIHTSHVTRGDQVPFDTLQNDKRES